MSVTATQFKTTKPSFAAVPDETVEAYLGLTALVVDDSWPSAYADVATIAYTCHLLTLDGLGAGPESAQFRSALQGYQTIQSGALSLTRFKDTATGTQLEWLKQTVCGRQYLQYLMAVKSGPRIVSGSNGLVPSPYAKDHPFYGWL
jgi:hypothetical protein